MTVRELLRLLDGVNRDCTLYVEGANVYLFSPGATVPGVRIQLERKELQDLTGDEPRIKHVDGTWEDVS